jgi:hypothetical protein
MMTKLKLRYIAILCIAAFIFVFLLFMLLVAMRPHKDSYPVEYATLKIVQSTVLNYKLDHSSELPSEEAFKESMANYIEDVNVLSKIRYFKQGNEFVVVSPGKNKKFDTPEGFENVRSFTGESDDYVLFYPYKAGPDSKIKHELTTANNSHRFSFISVTSVPSVANIETLRLFFRFHQYRPGHNDGKMLPVHHIFTHRDIIITILEPAEKAQGLDFWMKYKRRKPRPVY